MYFKRIETTSVVGGLVIRESTSSISKLAKTLEQSKVQYYEKPTKFLTVTSPVCQLGQVCFLGQRS